LLQEFQYGQIAPWPTQYKKFIAKKEVFIDTSIQDRAKCYLYW